MDGWHDFIKSYRKDTEGVGNSTDDEMTMSKTAERDRHLHSSSLARQLAVDAERGVPARFAEAGDASSVGLKLEAGSWSRGLSG
ncbi:hypothetical protein AXG93_1626s1020 [Marchantia polymorpha subsp. ruderalis]|uniref:Uncharacterized protein n=1 Tax=Marchantia polymorpha subsp. ruderalis TaxID=1480154 RepID=A0A176W9N0_MARPO|nr:hypothetical protein AXG93_1626s1020 [Marchantia polymorpha subsp. ruderalis]